MPQEAGRLSRALPLAAPFGHHTDRILALAILRWVHENPLLYPGQIFRLSPLKVFHLYSTVKESSHQRLSVTKGSAARMPALHLIERIEAV